MHKIKALHRRRGGATPPMQDSFELYAFISP